ncbi:unnamed protein product [Prorocentrum cordatum]|uniref:Protein kinase domain-containing protein n=1 Tax=Prorocentrum cordatum TaxID=2364126 RepID=A0ABN9U7V2_9DINO|nr:unnamed protein product [Polarella glacialis]
MFSGVASPILLNFIVSLSYAARPAFNGLLQETLTVQPDEALTHIVSIGAPSLFQSVSNGTSYTLPANQVSNLIQQDGFNNVIAQFLAAQQSWAACKATIKARWDAYTSSYIEHGHMIWVSNLKGYGEDTVFCMVVETYEDSLLVDVLNDEHQPVNERHMISYNQIESHADSLSNLITQIRHLPCVAATMTNLQTAISSAARTTGAYLAYKLLNFQTSGYAKLAFGIGASWRGSGVLPHSLRVEGGLGVVLWPSSLAGTITHEVCTGKDSNRKAVDLSISLEIGFDRSCFTGYGLSFAGALQLPHGQEVVGGFGIDCDLSNKCMEECIANGGASPVCYPKGPIRCRFGLRLPFSEPDAAMGPESTSSDETPTSTRLVLELCEGGELYDRIQQKQYYPEHEAKACCRQLMEAVSYMHGKGIMHRDLKPENILLASKVSNTDVKISDFGLAKISRDFPRRLPRSHSICGSDFYLAPEVIKQEEYGREIDIWAVGVITYVLLSGSLPFFHNVLHKLYRQDDCRAGPELPRAGVEERVQGRVGFHPETAAGARRGPPHRRPGALSHPWLRGTGGSSFGSFEDGVLSRRSGGALAHPNYYNTHQYAGCTPSMQSSGSLSRNDSSTHGGRAGAAPHPLEHAHKAAPPHGPGAAQERHGPPPRPRGSGSVPPHY